MVRSIIISIHYYCSWLQIKDSSQCFGLRKMGLKCGLIWHCFWTRSLMHKFLSIIFNYFLCEGVFRCPPYPCPFSNFGPNLARKILKTHKSTGKSTTIIKGCPKNFYKLMLCPVNSWILAKILKHLETFLCFGINEQQISHWSYFNNY